MTTASEYLARIYASFSENLFRGTSRFKTGGFVKEGDKEFDTIMQELINEGKTMTDNEKITAASVWLSRPSERQHAVKERVYNTHITVSCRDMVPWNHKDMMKVGQRWFVATNGSEFGQQAWQRWANQTDMAKYEQAAFNAAWKHFKIEAGQAKHDTVVQPVAQADVPLTAPMLLAKAKEILEQRAKDYDKPEGERSMGTVAQMFNLATGRTGERFVSESEAWLIMDLLKIVRDRSTPHGHADSCEDLVSYSALYGEARMREKRNADYVAQELDEAHLPPMVRACPLAFNNVENFAGTKAAPEKASMLNVSISNLRELAKAAAQQHRDTFNIALTKEVLGQFDVRYVRDLEDDQCMPFALAAFKEIGDHQP